MTDLELVRLPNGVRVAFDPMPGLATAALGVWQRVGARHEGEAENGVAHLFEHMAFKGAGGRDARAFAEAVEAVGASVNAATSYESTAYYARTVAEHAPFALDLIADILFTPHWAPDDLEKEKGVVAQERGEVFDQPGGRVFELHQGALFPGQALGRPILGTPASLEGVRVESLEEFREAHLSPERVVISIAGAYERAAFLDKAEARFGALRAKAPAPAAPARPVRGAAREARKIEQTHLVMSWPAPPAGEPSLIGAYLLVEIFGGGMSSRLFQEVREARGLVYDISAFLDTYEDAGRLMVYAGCEAKNAREVAKIVAEQLACLADTGPSEAEMARANAVAGAQLLMSMEAPTARAEACASQTFLRDRLIGVDEYKALFNAVTPDQVRELARAALAGPACAAALGPKAGHGALALFHAPS